MRLFLELAVTLVAVFFFVFSVVVGGIAYNCSGYQEATGRETKTVAMTCYVKETNNWYSYEEYRLRNATKGN